MSHFSIKSLDDEEFNYDEFLQFVLNRITRSSRYYGFWFMRLFIVSVRFGLVNLSKYFLTNLLQIYPDPSIFPQNCCFFSSPYDIFLKRVILTYAF